MRYDLPNACGLLFCVCLSAFLSLEISSARAQAAGTPAGSAATDWPSKGSASSSAAAASKSAHKGTSKAGAERQASRFAVERRAAERREAWTVNDEPYISGGAPQWRYFVEFRARNAATYGHMYVMLGEVNDRHQIVKSTVAGFYPAGDDRDCVNCSVYYWTIGHLLPVPSEIGASDGDLEEQYVLARFRVWVDAQQYQSLIAYIDERKARKGPWNLFFANCVTFGRDVASFLKVKMPPILAFAPSVLMYPKDVIDGMREANGLEHEQAPLRDAAGQLPVDVGTDWQHANAAAETPRPSSAAAETPLPSSATKWTADRHASY
jgi:hypothetical protein